MTLRKRNIVVACAVLLIAALAIGGTLAFFTDESEVTNTFTVGDLDIDVTEEWNPEDGEEMVPGDNVEKVPVVTSLSGDGYLRVIMTVMDKNDGVAEGTTVTDSDRLNKILSTLYYDPTGTVITLGTKYSTTDIAGWASSGIKTPVNSTEFVQHSAVNGVYTYYYTNPTLVNGKTDIFAEGQEVTLFTRVIIPSDWTQEDLELLGKYDIVIKAEAIQEEGFGSQSEAFTALDAQITATP